jgi:trehalose 6-phosphate synthase
MGICPWRNELLEGLLGSSILGFHTQLHCNNFVDSVDRYLETRIDREHNAVVMQGRRTLIRPYPISLEWPVHWLENAPTPEECRAQVWAELGLKPDALLGVGVDRLDYTKGVEERLLTVEVLLERYPEFRGRFSFAQLAAPSRTKIQRYKELNDTVERLAERINSRFGSESYRPIILLRFHHEPPEVFRFFRAAHLCYVSSLHDGMNLVAKEFVAARTDLRGVLVLSEFTGAARELTEALIVNPYDLESSSDALAAALMMPEDEQEDRMRPMRSLLAQFNVYRWAGRMLVDAARLRNQERVAERLAERSNCRNIDLASMLEIRRGYQSGRRKAPVDRIKNDLPQLVAKRSQGLVVQVAVNGARQTPSPCLRGAPRFYSQRSFLKKDVANFIFKKADVALFVLQDRQKVRSHTDKKARKLQP